MTRSKPASARRAGAAAAGGPAPGGRVAVYLRISTDEEHQPFSLEAQRHRLLAFIPTQPGWTHVTTYEDQVSGAKANRPYLDRAMR
ncbi:MAG: recombinase family protein, partial [Acidimicrobiales bacterium]